MNETPKVETVRVIEAILFAADHPLGEDELKERLHNPDADVSAALAELDRVYEGRGVNLVKINGKWMFRTAPDLAFLLRREMTEQRRLSRAAVETLAIIAYHQPVTRAEIEEIRGVGLGRGTLDILMEAEWVRPLGRRRSPGRPITYGTTEEFLVHFGLETIDDLPGFDELKAAGLLDPIEKAMGRAERELEEQAEREAPLLAAIEGGQGDPEGEDLSPEDGAA